MTNLKDKKEKKIIVMILIIIFLAGIISFIYFQNKGNDEIILEQGEIISEKNNKEKNESENKKSNEDDSLKNNENSIFVHIIGEVKNEGIIELKIGDRIVNAIEKAGGITEQADLRKINLAYVLSDGQKVRIPSINENVNESSSVPYITNAGGDNVIQEGGNGKETSKVNINTATQTELETISGVGPSLAAKIIDYREKNGKFKKVEDLKNVSGIGEAKYEGMKKYVVIK